MMLRDSDLTDRDRQRIWAAQLADMPLAVIVAWLEEKHWAYPREHRKPALCGWCVPELDARVDALPPGYPPLADADLPFDGEDRRT